MKKKWMIAIVAVVIVVASIAGAIYYFNNNVSGDYVATVDGTKVTQVEYTFFLSLVKNQMESASKLTDESAKAAFWNSKIDGRLAIDVAKDKALDSIKGLKIQTIKASKDKITLTQDELDQFNKNVDQLISDQGGRDATDKKIKETYGISLDDFIKIRKDWAIVDKFSQEQMKNVQVSNDEMKDYYKNKINNGTKNVARHILISTQDENKNPLPQDKINQAKAKAEGIYEQVKAGGDMKTLAAKYSEDSGSKDNSGQYVFDKGQMVKEFEDWTFNAAPGDVGLVTTKFGFHIMKKPTYEELTSDALDTIKGLSAQSKYLDLLVQWKKDPQYNLVKNTKVLS